MGFPRQEYWSGWPFLLQGIFLIQGSNSCLLHCRQILYHSLPLRHQAPFFFNFVFHSSVQFSLSVMCDPKDCSTPGFRVHHQLLEPAQTHVHQVGDAIKPFHPLLFPSPPAFNLSHHQGLFQWVSSSYQVAKVLEFQLQHQSFQWIFKTGFL